MDAPDNAGGSATFGQLLRDANVSRLEFEVVLWVLTDGTRQSKKAGIAATARFIAFLKALQEGDSTEADSILRSWGIRRQDGQAALSHSLVQLPDVPARKDKASSRQK